MCSTAFVRLVGVFSTCWLLTACAAEAADAAPPQPATITQLAFKSDSGAVHAWKDLAGAKATVVVFVSFDCPMSNSYAKPLSELAKDYVGKGVKIIGVCPCDEPAAYVAGKAKEFELNFPVFKDDKLVASNTFDAKITPSVFLVDAGNEVRYRGLIDDAYSKRLVPNKEIKERYLRVAIDEVLARKPVGVSKTDPIGCPIVREIKRGSGTDVTYYKDVLPILQNRCQTCHRPGEVGPFALMNYRQARTWADDIKDYTHTRKMPPWKVTGGKDFEGDRRLSDKELQTLAKWVDSGCPEGDPKQAPPERKFPQGWQLGKPDLVLTMDEDFVLGATGKDHFRVYVMPTNLKEDKHVVAVEVRPGNPRVVHHTLNFYDATGSARKLEQQAREKRQAEPAAPDAVDVGPGFSSSMGIGFRPNPADLLKGKPPIGALGGWAPGIMPKFLPEGTGFYLPAGSDFVMQVHYHRDGRVEKDRTQVGLYFAKKPVDKPMLGLVVPGRFKTDGPAASGRFAALGYIPAGDSHFVARGGTTALEDCTIHTIMPHMHLLGKSVKITMIMPDGKKETIIDVGEWDYNWQEQYILKEPIKVKSGTRFEIEAVFDNSAANPNNPSTPPVDVRFGEQTTNEMLFGFLGATKNEKGVIPYFILQRPDFGRQMPRR